MTQEHFSLPADFVRRMERQLSEQAPAFFAALTEPAALALRRNPLRLRAQAQLQAFIDGPVPWEPLGSYLRSGVQPGAGIAHAAGAFYLQEASAMVPVAVLDPQPGERVLDLCAAPGGKSTQIAARLGGTGLLLANDPEPSRAKILAANLERMGAGGSCVVSASPAALAARWPGYFDAVLCDAPCSGEGMFRRDPASRAQWKPASPAGCAKRQAGILDCAAELLRPGGRLVYSTCTFNREENEDNVAAFLVRHPEFSPEDFTLPGLGNSQGGMMRVWPHRVRGDGHFAARLRKAGDARPAGTPGGRIGRDAPALLRALTQEIGAIPPVWTQRPERVGDCLYSVAPERPDLDGLRVLSPGLRLLRAGRNHVEPAHALAMELGAEGIARCRELDEVQAWHFLAGEALPCPTDMHGWTLLCRQGLPLGWGKAADGQMKNHLPKGLRLRRARATPGMPAEG